MLTFLRFHRNNHVGRRNPRRLDRRISSFPGANWHSYAPRMRLFRLPGAKSPSTAPGPSPSPQGARPAVVPNPARGKYMPFCPRDISFLPELFGPAADSDLQQRSGDQLQLRRRWHEVARVPDGLRQHPVDQTDRLRRESRVLNENSRVSRPCCFIW